MKEIWKDIPGLDGRYKVSNMGRIMCASNNRIRKPQKDKDGYCQLVLKKSGGYVYPKVHRLVAELFIENPDNLPVVNHKNEVKDDNRAENLEWCTVAYNNSYGSKVRMVARTNVETGSKEQFLSINDASRKTGIDRKSIYRWCKKQGGIGHGWEWAFA